jgi:hypothetical protein
MFAAFETSREELSSKGSDAVIRFDTNIQCLSWMSKSGGLAASHSLQQQQQQHQQQQPVQPIPSLQPNTPTGGSTKSSQEAQSSLEGFIRNQEGWLACGNSNAAIGCTYTSCLSDEQIEYLKQRDKQQPCTSASANIEESQPDRQSSPNNPNTTLTSQSQSSAIAQLSTSSQTNMNRTNFNLRGHKSDIKLVRWNEPYQKLASCDSKGVIHVWARYEGRWSVELINDRGNCVNDFAWSHDGRMAVICYQDGFVLVGSVNGQRYWSHLYDLANCTMTAASWTPNDQNILLGLSNGAIMVVDSHGVMLTKHVINNECCIVSLSYSSPKFFIDESNNSSAAANSSTTSNTSPTGGCNHSQNVFSALFRLGAVRPPGSCQQSVTSASAHVNNADYTLACSFRSSSLLYLLKSYEDLDPIIVDTMLDGLKFEWSGSGKLLAVGGYRRKLDAAQNKTSNLYENFIKFYTTQGNLIYQIEVTPGDVCIMNGIFFLKIYYIFYLVMHNKNKIFFYF